MEAPTHRLHRSLGGLLALRPGELTVDLCEEDLPGPFTELDDETQWRLVSVAVREFLSESGLTCQIAVVRADDEEILKRAGATPLSDRGAYELALGHGRARRGDVDEPCRLARHAPRRNAGPSPLQELERHLRLSVGQPHVPQLDDACGIGVRGSNP